MNEPDATSESQSTSVAFLGPSGSFGEQALYALRELDLYPNIVGVPVRTMPEALLAVQNDAVEYALVALENSIEGTVNVTLDTLIFDTELLIQRELVLPIELCLLAPPGVRLSDLKRVVSFPVAVNECREFLATHIPNAEILAANSTSDAVRQVSRSSSRQSAAIGTRLAGDIYKLNVLKADISDHRGNETRFVLVGKTGIPARTGVDRTSIVLFQADNKPGNLHAYLGQFSARNINLSKLESRPTKRGLGDYCFIVEMEGHVETEIIADCLRDLHIVSGNVKFLGSYPAVTANGRKRRRDASSLWRAADAWVRDLRSQIIIEKKRRKRRFEVVK